MKKSMLIAVCLVLLFSGCKNAPKEGTSETENPIAIVQGNIDNQETADPAIVSKESSLKTEDGIVLDYRQPELSTKVFRILPNVEKTYYVVFTGCAVAGYGGWTQLEFFKSDGTFLRSVTNSDNLEVNWNDQRVTFSGDYFRLTTTHSVFYYNVKNGETLNVDGGLLCSDSGADLIYDQSFNKLFLVKDYKIIDTAEICFDDQDFANSEFSTPKQYHLDWNKKTATFENKNIRLHLTLTRKR